ncbi:MAG: alanine--tRNA ligase [Candidatus Saccharimonadales bacterium]
MTTQEIRSAYLEFFKARGHQIIPRSLLVPKEDPTTLFTGSGMQPLLPYLLGQEHPAGVRLVDSQTCLRVQDIEEVGDNRHTTFFEMLGNWSLGDYFKRDQIAWVWEFLSETVGLDKERIFVSCYSGNKLLSIPKDEESAAIWSEILSKAGLDTKQVEIGSMENGSNLGEQGGRIFFYEDKNWWSRSGGPEQMPDGEPGGPDSELFYLYPQVKHNKKYGEHCHVNCDCGRYIELGNCVFMEYQKTKDGFTKLPKRNVDYGGGLERIAAAALDDPDVYSISLMRPIIETLERLSGKTYESHTTPMRVITDHLRAATFLAVDGVVPSNKEQGYVLRRLIRRALRFAFELGIEQNFIEEVASTVADLYADGYPEVAARRNTVIESLSKEEKLFRQTLRKGLKQLDKLAAQGHLSGSDIFTLYDTFGFPTELSAEEAATRGITLEDGWRESFEQQMKQQRDRSQTAAKGAFKGGLGGHDIVHKKYHTATHLLYKALRDQLGEGVIQHGSNITKERLRFDFSYPNKLTPEQLKSLEDEVNKQIGRDLLVCWSEYPPARALGEMGALGAFGDRYGETVKVYAMTPQGEDKPYSLEICGGPHVEHTGQLGEDGKRFKIIKEESSSAGVRRIKAVLA